MKFRQFNEALRMGTPFDDIGKLFKGGSKKTKSSSKQVSTPHQQPEYDNLLQGAGSWVDQGGFDKNFGGQSGFQNVAGMTANQLAGIQGSQQMGQALQGIYSGQGVDSLQNYMGQYDPNKTGLNAAMRAVNNQMNWDYNTNVAPEIRSGAQGAGQFGSSRHGIAEGIAQSQLGQQKMNANSQMAFQDQQQFNQNQLGMLGNLGAISKGLNAGSGLQFDAGSMEQQQNQAEISGQLEKWMYENNASLNDLLAYQQLISGDMGGVGTTDTVSKGPSGGSGGWGALASVGGAALGSMAGGVGTAAGSQIGSALAGKLS